MKNQYKRALDFNALPKKQTLFLLGPRKTGKSTYLKNKFPDSLYIDLLDSGNLIKYSDEPSLLTQEIKALLDVEPQKLDSHVIIDEIQNVPKLLNEVQRLIEDLDIGFILCGSSARKLRRDHVNLLGGRAWLAEMHPLAFPEINNYDIYKTINNGKIPAHYDSENSARDLEGYVNLYLKEEILEEGLTRNLSIFHNFLESVAFTNGEVINYSNIARDVGVGSKTVKEYYRILEDTLVGSFLLPYTKNSKRSDVLLSPKFYLFDTGVANYLKGIKLEKGNSVEFGKSFEHLIYTELVAYKSYKNRQLPINFWNTSNGVEIDFILGNGEVAVEVKSSKRLHPTKLKNMKIWMNAHKSKKNIVVTREDTPRKVGDILLLPYKTFLEMLWAGEVI